MLYMYMYFRATFFLATHAAMTLTGPTLVDLLNKCSDIFLVNYHELNSISFLNTHRTCRVNASFNNHSRSGNSPSVFDTHFKDRTVSSRCYDNSLKIIGLE